ncbi:MAG TPA: hypothetical protein VFO85_11685 [Vicinamibacteria bacterium]|nr:hypothetical protein [Vicinamibacteria bacterium]
MHILGVALAVLTAVPASTAPQRRTWRVERQGLTFELSADDLRAWTGSPTGAPAFSVAALLDAEKKEFDRTAAEVARERAGSIEQGNVGLTVMDASMSYEAMSVVGPLVAYRESWGGYQPGTAHPSRYEIQVVRDLSRPGAEVSLLDFYSEAQIVRALKADRFVRAFADPEGGFQSAATLDEVLGSLSSEYARSESLSDVDGGDCGFEVTFSRDMLKHFYFHDVVKDKVAVRVALAPANEWCTRIGGRQHLGLLLPLPAALKDDLLRARRGEAGFLAAARKPASAFTWSAEWEVDLQELVPRPSPAPSP